MVAPYVSGFENTSRSGHADTMPSTTSRPITKKRNRMMAPMGPDGYPGSGSDSGAEAFARVMMTASSGISMIWMSSASIFDMVLLPYAAFPHLT